MAGQRVSRRQKDISRLFRQKQALRGDALRASRNSRKPKGNAV